jgi:radical SAM superfamily enzyme YgiQ (UPF0313 family)
MSWKIIERYRQLLAAERGAVPKNWGGRLAVCLVYPNIYRTAMSNLGFQAVYGLLNAMPDVVCERAFLPDPADLREYEKSRSTLLSLETQRPLAEFDIIAFSVSFESDYLHIPTIFHLSGIPPFATTRNSGHPLVLAGGAALFLNPEPVADFLDMVCLGEAEAIFPCLLDILRGEGEMPRPKLLESAAQLPGIYVPSLYRVVSEGAGKGVLTPLNGAPATVKRLWATDLDQHATVSVIRTPNTEFSDLYLIELSRGCPRGCRFCAAGFIYLPYRQRSVEMVKEEVNKGLGQGRRIGLVGAAVSDFRGIGQLSRHILAGGGGISVSSLRVDPLNEELLEALIASGHKTIAIAPEGGSQRLRDLIKKDLEEEQILAACDRLIAAGILNLKLYFIIGLPTETMTDMEELVRLVELIRDRVTDAARRHKRLGEVILSVNPFIPKPFTPFQWCGMEGVKELELKGKFLRQAVGRLSNVRLKLESPRDAMLQGLISRGDRQLAPFLVRATELGNWRRAARELGLPVDSLCQRQIPLDERLPWDFIDSGNRELLVREYRAAFG